MLAAIIQRRSHALRRTAIVNSANMTPEVICSVRIATVRSTFADVRALVSKSLLLRLFFLLFLLFFLFLGSWTIFAANKGIAK